ncbi:MAG: LemA family protein [Arenimonas sp.]|uniref:LemA family protein n=1 Tax=Arenimonas sp. TaxID=1872635 RepID=UPI0025B8B14C|nr:LemA family protein [Arenimonas sp.]MBW8367899.1 LemA family protein [Arenimonas sp.]
MTLVFGLLFLALMGWGIFAFNRLVRLRNQVKAGWSDIDVQLMRRHDLVPRLVEAVRAYAGHEHAVLERVTQLRSQAMATTSPARLAGLEQALESDVARLLIIKEAYPELKASENFLALQRDLVDVEDHLQYARRFYNGAVRGLNDGVQRFPDLLVARALGFNAAEFFRAGDDAAVAPKLELGA